ncbi:hypothetical protein NESM_000293900 [Novymonas esmeraldas]|uniref:Uncharacterized protein n=1 Tax=Novymonas esmeraldas TaxID=1808958 RepID=A0AAW0F6I4_9TRYP
MGRTIIKLGGQSRDSAGERLPGPPAEEPLSADDALRLVTGGDARVVDESLLRNFLLHRFSNAKSTEEQGQEVCSLWAVGDSEAPNSKSIAYEDWCS